MEHNYFSHKLEYVVDLPRSRDKLITNQEQSMINSNNRIRNMRIFCAAGPGNVIEAHKFWRKGTPFPGEFALTYSSQIEEYCLKADAFLYMASYHPEAHNLSDGKFRIQHYPKFFKNPKGLFYHIGEIGYAAALVYKAIKFRSSVFIVDYSTSHYFVFLLLKLFSIKVVLVLHNSFWPRGYRPRKGIHKYINQLNALFLKHGTYGVIGLSPECCRQVTELVGEQYSSLLEFRPQYIIDHFKKIAQPPSWDKHPFRILFVGRIVANKGVFDILDMADAIEKVAPGQVHWDICGDGPDLEPLIKQCAQKNLGSVVTIHGWTTPENQLEKYSTAHASIVPTKSDFAEGLAKTAIESVLFGRPVITNSVVPAAEVLEAAVILAETDNVKSYVREILTLVNDEELYAKKVKACHTVSAPFGDYNYGLTAALERTLNGQRGTASALSSFERPPND